MGEQLRIQQSDKCPAGPEYRELLERGTRSLRSQRLDWIDQTSLHCLITHSKQSNQQHNTRRKNHRGPTDVDTVGKLMKPAIHGEPNSRPDYYARHEHQFQEVLI